jgi:phospholipase C
MPRPGTRAARFATLIALAAVLAGCTPAAPQTPAPTSRGARPPQASVSPVSPTAHAIDHIVVIVEENKPAASVLGSASAPYLNALAARFASATRYSAITHPSLPNYLALTSGTTAGITSDCNPPGGRCVGPSSNLASELDDAGRSWRMFGEGMPAPCFARNAGRYAVKHVPFLYYRNVTADPSYCASHVVPFSRFAGALASADALPEVSFVSPDLCNDMHDCSIATGDSWLARQVPQILESPVFTTQRSLLVITFDEGDSRDNVIPTVFAGSAAATDTTDRTPYTHYSLLRTIEDAYGLAPLTANDRAARPMTGMLG